VVFDFFPIPLSQISPSAPSLLTITAIAPDSSFSFSRLAPNMARVSEADSDQADSVPAKPEPGLNMQLAKAFLQNGGHSRLLADATPTAAAVVPVSPAPQKTISGPAVQADLCLLHPLASAGAADTAASSATTDSVSADSEREAGQAPSAAPAWKRQEHFDAQAQPSLPPPPPPPPGRQWLPSEEIEARLARLEAAAAAAAEAQQQQQRTLDAILALLKPPSPPPPPPPLPPPTTTMPSPPPPSPRPFEDFADVPS
jgi:hypothetical protein